jgi:hypothetical protein
MPPVGETPIHTSWEGDHVNVHKSAVTAALRDQGEHDKAQQAECSLPRTVDTERDAGLLRRLDVDPRSLAGDVST